MPYLWCKSELFGFYAHSTLAEDDTDGFNFLLAKRSLLNQCPRQYFSQFIGEHLHNLMILRPALLNLVSLVPLTFTMLPACATLTTTILGAGIGIVHRMTLRTDVFPISNDVGMIAAKTVNPLSNRLQMVRINAAAVMAEMVQAKTIGDRALECQIGKSMR